MTCKIVIGSVLLSPAPSPGNSLPSLDSFGPLADRVGFVTDPSPMEVYQDNDSGARPDSQEISKAKQLALANNEEDEDIIGLQMEKS